jgi:hypothetical protein
MNTSKYIIDIVSFLIPSMLDNYYISDDTATSISVGIACAITCNGIQNHLKKKTTTKLKESLTTTAIDAAKIMGLVKKDEIFREEIECILPSLQIFVGLNVLNIYLLKYFKLGALFTVASGIFQHAVYDSLRENESENYKNIIKKLNIIFSKHIENHKAKSN